MKYGYIRTSTRKQHLRRQKDGLSGLCDALHVEKGRSAVSQVRPVFDALIKKMKSGDTLVVWDLDRAFRSTIEALVTAKDLQKRDIGFEVVGMNIDIATPQGMYMYTIWAAGGEYESAMLHKRTMQGLEAARRCGKRLGRRPKLKPHQIRKIQYQARSQPDFDRKRIANRYHVSPQTIRRVINATPSERPHHAH